MFSSAVSTGIRLKNWKMKPSLSRRSLVRSPSSSPVISVPSSETEPVVGRSRPGEDVHQRRLAGARRAHDRAEAAALEVDAHTGERVDGGGALAVAAVYVGGGDDRVHGAAGWQGRRLRAVRLTGMLPAMEPSEMWGSGDYAAVADKIADAGELLVERAGIEPGQRVLDVACGTGNATIPAAQVGARVTGLDFSPELLEIARERGADAKVEVEWIEGDAQALPFEDAGFDRVHVDFGHMFAPDQERTAAELLRVVRPGGRIAIACWTPSGNIGGMFQALAAINPPPPGAQSPLLWGTEDHVRNLLGDAEFSRAEVVWRSSSVESYAEFMETSFGPLIAAREAVGDVLHETYLRFLNDVNEADDGTCASAASTWCRWSSGTERTSDQTLHSHRLDIARLNV